MSVPIERGLSVKGDAFEVVLCHGTLKSGFKFDLLKLSGRLDTSLTNSASSICALSCCFAGRLLEISAYCFLKLNVTFVSIEIDQRIDT